MLFRNKAHKLVSIIQHNYNNDYYYYEEILNQKGINLPKEKYNILSLCKCEEQKKINNIKEHKRKN